MKTGSDCLNIGRLTLRAPKGREAHGSEVLGGLAHLGESALRQLELELRGLGRSHGAAIGRIRGSGAGVSFGRLVARLEADHPMTLKSPFENCDLVSGAVWSLDRINGESGNTALLKLRFEAGAVDLPLHCHERSDRFIIVLEGRGYFHVSDEPPEAFNGENVRTTPVRERDALMFTRGVVHTFSSPSEPLVLLSYHTPFIPLEDSDQYTVPGCRLVPRDLLARQPEAQVTCDPAWNVLACWPGL